MYVRSGSRGEDYNQGGESVHVLKCVPDQRAYCTGSEQRASLLRLLKSQQASPVQIVSYFFEHAKVRSLTRPLLSFEWADETSGAANQGGGYGGLNPVNVGQGNAGGSGGGGGASGSCFTVRQLTIEAVPD